MLNPFKNKLSAIKPPSLVSRVSRNASWLAEGIEDAFHAIRPDERVVVFETSAHLDETKRRWTIPVHAWVFDEGLDSGWRRQMVSQLFAKRHPRADPETLLRYRGRLWPFLANDRSGRDVRVSITTAEGKIRSVGRTSKNGHVLGSIQLPAKLLKGQTELQLSLRLPDRDSRKITGRVQLVPPTGVTVISDIDDTIKVSRILQRKELFPNTFINPYVAVEGMASRYRDWQSQGAAFHYVSGTPWQLYPTLRKFMAEKQFPSGSLHLRYARLFDRTIMNMFVDAHSYKTPPIRELLQLYPQRDFVLIGDLGEHDAEIYQQMATEFPEQVKAIWLRQPEEVETPEGELRNSLAELFESNNISWGIFTHGDELPETLISDLSLKTPKIKAVKSKATGKAKPKARAKQSSDERVKLTVVK